MKESEKTSILGENIWNHFLEKGLVSRVYEELSKINKKKIKVGNPVFLNGQDLDNSPKRINGYG